MVRVLICGGRDFTNKRLMMTTMGAAEALHGEFACVIHGGAKGADEIGGKWAEWKGLPVFECRANWTKFGKGAGPIRNQWMLEHGRPDLVVAFPTPKSVGTYDMIRRAEEAGVEVMTATYSDQSEAAAPPNSVGA